MGLLWLSVIPEGCSRISKLEWELLAVFRVELRVGLWEELSPAWATRR